MGPVFSLPCKAGEGGSTNFCFPFGAPLVYIGSHQQKKGKPKGKRGPKEGVKEQRVDGSSQWGKVYSSHRVIGSRG